MKLFPGAVAIVTGASSGIGEATARLLSEKGVRVVLAARSAGKLQKLARALPSSYMVVTDMTKPRQIRALVQKTVKKFGRIDVLVNNAGRGYDAPVEFINAGRFHDIFDLDVVGAVIAMQEVIPVMRKQGGGSIVNVSSGTALMILPEMAAYASLKKAIAHISLTAREELANDHIAVSVVYPYVTDSNFEKNTLKDHVAAWDGEELPRPPDAPEYAAQKILEAVRKGEAEVFAHEWMKR